MTKPKIAVIGTGGTIVSSGSTATQMTGYSITDADIHTIVTALPELNDIAEIATFSVFNIGSSESSEYRRCGSDGSGNALKNGRIR